MSEETIRARIDGIFAPDQNILRAFPARIVVAVWKIGCVVELRIACSELEIRDCATWAVAGTSAKCHAIVGGVEDGVAVRCRVHGYFSSRAGEGQDAFRAWICPVFPRLGFDEVKRFVPRDLLPFVLAAVFAGSFHGVQNPVFVIFDLIKRDAPRAKSAMRNGVGWITFHFYDFIVFDRNDDAASDWMVARGGTRRRSSLGVCRLRGLLPSFSLHSFFFSSRFLTVGAGCDYSYLSIWAAI